MNATLEDTRNAVPSADARMVRHRQQAGRQTVFDPCADARSAGYRAMADAYHHTGGLLDVNDVLQRLGRKSDQPISTLAKWIVGRELVNFTHSGQIFVPTFQFLIADMSLRPCARNVVLELAGACDDWDIAQWFATPNKWLDGVAPADLVASAPQVVMQAARADRLALTG
jgi:hypothetical protein